MVVRYRVPYFESCILNCARQPVVSARSSKGQEMATRLEYAQAVGPHLRIECNTALIPMTPHERIFVGWVCYDGVDAGVGHFPQHVEAVPEPQRDGVVAPVRLNHDPPPGSPAVREKPERDHMQASRHRLS